MIRIESLKETDFAFETAQGHKLITNDEAAALVARSRERNGEDRYDFDQSVASLGRYYDALPVNAPKCQVHHNHRDRAMRFFENNTSNPDAYYSTIVKLQAQQRAFEAVGRVRCERIPVGQYVQQRRFDPREECPYDGMVGLVVAFSFNG